MNESCGPEVRANDVDRLHRSRLFAGTDRALVERYAPSFEFRRIAAGTTLVLGGDSERSVYVIRRGSVRLQLRAGRGGTLLVALLLPGDVFGVEALLGARPLARFAVCSQRTMLLSARAAVLEPALPASPRLSANVARILVRELEGVATTLYGLRYADLAACIYAVLKRVALEYGVAVAAGTLLDIALNADDVAALARCSPDEAAAALFFLERDGRIQTNGSLITLLAPQEDAFLFPSA
ncbi:MAG TPA: Crp/Fnr family transcriptional regulator [Candidatus Acidoferrum sp.]|nr:Crp/Fnr family transcriptional regulator [Candidatus Acidoferrum sp.]